MNKAGIYRFRVDRGARSPKFYIGQAGDPDERRKQHFRALRANRHDNVKMQRAFAKYGEAAFSFSIILICDGSNLTMYEQAIVDFYFASFGERDVLNVMRECVVSHSGVKRRPETLKKMSEALRGKKRTPEQNAANSERQRGMVLGPDIRAKISATHKLRNRHPNSLAALEKGRTSPARLVALRATLCGRPKIHSEETKDKISQTLTGRKQSDDLIERRVAPLRGRKQSADAIAKRVASRLANAKAKEPAPSCQK